MGLFKKAKRLVKKPRKFIKKLIPKEIRPFVPYIAAAMGPAGLASSGIFANPAVTKALIAGGTKFATDDEADLKDIGITAALAASPDLLKQGGEGIGAKYGKDAAMARQAASAANTGSFFVPETAEIGKLASVADKVASVASKIPTLGEAGSTLGTQAKLAGGLGAVDATRKLAEIQQDELDEYNRKLREQGITNSADRRRAIRDIYLGVGYTEDYVDGMLDRYGYKGGGGVMAAASMSNAMKKYYDQLEKLKKDKEKKAFGGRVGLFFGGKADIDPRAATFISNMTDRFIQSGMDPEEAREKAMDIAREEFPEDPDMSTKEAADFAAEGFKSAFGVESLFPQAPKPMGITPGFGNLPRMAEGGLMNLGGKEMDLRGGGFVPIGKKEKADDVPARLSKNEFVMTADAVRGAGNGDVNEGARKMYQTMDKLEAMA